MTSQQPDAVGYHTNIAREFDAKYQTRPAFRERFELWTKLMQQHLPRGAKVLDVGCGTGVFSHYLGERGHCVVGVDGSQKMLAVARERLGPKTAGRVTFVQGRVPFDDHPGPFGAIVCSSVLEYVGELGTALEGFRQRLQPGGILMVSFPNGLSLYRAGERLVHRLTGRPAYLRHVKSPPQSPRRFARGLAKASFDVLETHFYARPAPLFDPLHVGPIKPLVNNLFVMVCSRRA
ncbi:MAG: class I SAM-dependent methyltransferase [Nannocystaceae bacterium]